MNNLSLSTNESAPISNLSSANNSTGSGSSLTIGIHVIGVICLAGFLGNLLTFIVLWRERNKSGTIILLMALAAVDGVLVFLMLIIFPVALYITWPDSVGVILEPVTSGAFYIVQLMSVWLVCYVCAERFVAICFPYKAVTFCTAGNAKRGVTAIFIGCLILNAPTLCDVILAKQNIKKSDAGAAFINFYGSVVIPSLLFFIPCLLLIVTNIGLALGIQRAKKTHNAFAKDAQSKEKGNSIAAALNIVAVVTAFLLTQLPNAGIFLWIWVMKHRKHEHTDWMTLLTCVRFILISVNSSVNFLVYCLFYRRFRIGMIQLCLCRKPKRRTFISSTRSHTRVTLLPHCDKS